MGNLPLLSRPVFRIRDSAAVQRLPCPAPETTRRPHHRGPGQRLTHRAGCRESDRFGNCAGWSPGRSVLSSSVAEPPGPERVMLARDSGHSGRTKAKEELPSPSATTGIWNGSENNSSPSADRPTSVGAAEAGCQLPHDVADHIGAGTRTALTAAGGLPETPEGSCRRATWPGPPRSSPGPAAGR